MKPRKRLGNLKPGDEFIHEFITYKVGHADGHGYVYCTDVIAHKVTRMYIDCEVEVVENEK